ncbi:MAG: 50S ribosomal protein L30e [Candidatus Micrarchaeota archaeon]
MAEEVENVQEEVEEKVTKKIKVKKLVRRRKTKKERENPITVAIRLAVESGSVEFGTRTSISPNNDAKAKLFIMANNLPVAIKEKVEIFAKKSEIPIIVFDGSSMDLGSVCGKPYPVSVLSVYKEGSSNILDLAK